MTGIDVQRRRWSGALETGTFSIYGRKRRSSAVSQRPASSMQISKLLSRSKYLKVVFCVAAVVAPLQLWRWLQTSRLADLQPSRTPDPASFQKVGIRDVDSSENAISSTSKRALEPWEVTAEEVSMQIISPSYNIRVLRSILNHSNHTYQDMPNEAHGYLIQTFIWLHVVSARHPSALQN